MWGEIKGRQIPLTMRTIKEGELKMLLSLAFGNEVIGVIKGGRDVDRPYGFVIERAAYRYRAGIAWRDLAQRLGHCKAVHTRFRANSI